MIWRMYPHSKYHVSNQPVRHGDMSVCGTCNAVTANRRERGKGSQPTLLAVGHLGNDNRFTLKLTTVEARHDELTATPYLVAFMFQDRFQHTTLETKPYIPYLVMISTNIFVTVIP